MMPKTVVGLHLVRKIGLGNRNPLSGIYLLWVIWRERNNYTFNNVEDSMVETTSFVRLIFKWFRIL